MKLTNKLHLPTPLVNAVKGYEEKYKKSLFGHISTTTLIKPPQIKELTKRHGEAVTEDVADRLFALYGQVIHKILEESADEDALKEKRVSTEIDGIVLTGQYDLIEEGILYDYKFTSVWSYIFGSEEWELQSNINRYLLYKNGVEIKELKNVVMFRDFKQSQAGKGKYPTTPVVTVSLRMWNIEEAETYIKDRIDLFKKASKLPEEMLPECSDKDRWFNHKSKQFIRCERYCPVKPFCRQYNK